MSAPARKTVFVTGVTGSMGGATLRELLGRRERFDIVTLARPSARNRQMLAPYLDEPGVRIEWGDLTCYDDVARCVRGADFVLHAAALISPAADRNPEQAWKINVVSAENIIRAIKAQPDPDAIKLVSVGTVAATGDRLPPIHWGRTGDPLQPSVFDMYGCSKIAAERTVAESGLKYWVSSRQTFIAIADLTSLMDPIMFHQPLDTCIEFCTMEDSGRLLANACEDSVPEEFWRRFYNIGGGERCRLNYIELQQRSFDVLGMGKLEDLTERNWFATRNFHCHWFEDSDVLAGSRQDHAHLRLFSGARTTGPAFLPGASTSRRIPPRCRASAWITAVTSPGRPKHSTRPRCSGQRAFAAAAVNPRTWSRGRCSRRCAGAAASATCSRRRPTWYCAADTGVPNAPRPAGTMTSRRAAARSWPRCGRATTTAPKTMSTPATATRTSRPADVAGSTGHGGTGASQANARISHIPC